MLSCFVPGALLFLLPTVLSSATTLDDLKQLEIACYVPSHLPHGFRLRKVEITYEEPDAASAEVNRPLPLYSVEYGNGWNATFSIESAREGIGDRNIMEEEDTEETEIQSPFGPMYLIYRPKGKEGRKAEIKANWVSDATMNAETAKGPDSHPVLGRYHGFSATGITLAEFTKTVQSLHPVRGDKAVMPAATPVTTPPATASATPAAQTSALKIHPKVFNMIDCWVSDSESPVVTEINLDAVEKNGNQFNRDGVSEDGEWLRFSLPDTGGFMRYRVVESKGDHYKIEYEENGGGSLTTASVIEFDIVKRDVRRDGKPLNVRLLRVTSYNQK
ncbi:MAG: hypothetical protein DME94_11260 [Verrucomicrobia bacterium]|nr:MAG: hypothetical protein DME94_11260 [Verrucomicrobiota bacterium]